MDDKITNSGPNPLILFILTGQKIRHPQTSWLESQHNTSAFLSKMLMSPLSPDPHQIMDDGQDGFPRKQDDERIAKLSTFPQ